MRAIEGRDELECIAPTRSAFSGYTRWGCRCQRCYRASRNSSLRRRYGITVDDYDRMLEEQEGRCGICEMAVEEHTGHFHVDHCHDTGAVRGLLCVMCNRALGILGDTSEGVRRALRYLDT